MWITVLDVPYVIQFFEKIISGSYVLGSKYSGTKPVPRQRVFLHCGLRGYEIYRANMPSLEQ